MNDCVCEMSQRVPRPNLFVVGDAKCGTTSLFHLFAMAPEIGKPHRKEIHYFSSPELMERIAGPGDAGLPAQFVHDEASYLAKFAGIDADLPLIVDVSPSYLRSQAAGRIRAFAPEAKIIITLREPAAKVFSQYVHLWSEGRETLPFEAAYARSAERREAGFSDMFNYEGGGYYAEAVRHYLDIFGAERVHVILFEELIGDFEAERARLEAFLGVALPGALPHANISGRLRSPLLGAVLGNQKLRRLREALLPPGLRARISQALRARLPVDKPVLDPSLRAALRGRYAAATAELEAVLGRPTGWPAA
ncbi:sulfotransferase [soil metagenome]